MRAPDQIDTVVMGERENFMLAIAHAKDFGVPIDDGLALRFFDEIVTWQPTKRADDDGLGQSFIESFNRRMARYAGQILSRLAAPHMLKEHLDLERLVKIHSFVKRTSSWSALGALPFFAASEGKVVRVTSAIRAGLANVYSQHAGSAAAALEVWAELAVQSRACAVPRRLIEQLLLNIEGAKESGLHVMLNAAGKLLELNFLEGEDIERLTTALEELRAIYRYTDVLWDTRKAISLPLVRVSCIRLSAKLINHRQDKVALYLWLEERKTDPLPEVRFCLTERV